ncbi:HisA/HisF-related TIM barrel protein [Methylobacterium radiodurans]|uniref:Nickel transporter n=1 Tax=Methylobacterium radiodurans TaxID=2202828 RepID=A0A2U8VTJ8_9HYPH|nr:HisA/HisF-related TIM barrel protein [Methylobacterium radiodurans]AWN36690.1 nickel transporter [Methylobacterium radiodurans]
MRDGFAVIPVLDLRHGQVVQARRGERASYAPIETPLAKGSAPEAVAAGILAAFPAPLLYVADLDAIIDGAAPDRAALKAILAAIARVCPDTALWVDAGFRDPEATAAFLDAGLGRPVLGSESQRDADLVRALADRAVLSLDSRGDARLGPDALHDDASLWPRDVIVMTLARVGADAGPDLDGIRDVRGRAPRARVHAAGGVRGPDDLAALARAGAAGALVATALHDGRLRPEHMKALAG